MSVFENPRDTWLKRFFAEHYDYEDFHAVATGVYGLLQALGLYAAQSPLVYYLFGANARAINAVNWSQLGDHAYSMPTFAQVVMVRCTQNAWVRIISVDPEYIRQATIAGYGGPAITATQVITGIEHYLPANFTLRLFPTRGVAIVFRADTVVGDLNIWIEGNSEGIS